jgi:hypothetical protein
MSVWDLKNQIRACTWHLRRGFGLREDATTPQLHTQMAAADKYAHILQPLRDVADNFNIDIAHELEDYLAELEHISISFGAYRARRFPSCGRSYRVSHTRCVCCVVMWGIVSFADDGVTKLNFAEAAFIIQGSSVIYSKKVEYLYNLLYQTLDVLQERRKAGVDRLGSDAPPMFLFQPDHDFVSLDHDLKEGSNIDLDDLDQPAILGTSGVMPSAAGAAAADFLASVGLPPLAPVSSAHLLPHRNMLYVGSSSLTIFSAQQYFRLTHLVVHFLVVFNQVIFRGCARSGHQLIRGGTCRCQNRRLGVCQQGSFCRFSGVELHSAPLWRYGALIS